MSTSRGEVTIINKKEKGLIPLCKLKDKSHFMHEGGVFVKLHHAPQQNLVQVGLREDVITCLALSDYEEIRLPPSTKVEPCHCVRYPII